MGASTKPIASPRLLVQFQHADSCVIWPHLWYCLVPGRPLIREQRIMRHLKTAELGSYYCDEPGGQAPAKIRKVWTTGPR